MVHIYNGVPLSHTKRWSSVICDNMDGSRDYHTKQNKSVGKTQVLHDFTHIWDIKLKAKINRQDKQTKLIIWWLPEGRELGEAVKDKGGQIYGCGRRFDVGWWAYNAIYRWCITQVYTWNLCNLINQCHPINLIQIKEILVRVKEVWFNLKQEMVRENLATAREFKISLSKEL